MYFGRSVALAPDSVFVGAPGDPVSASGFLREMPANAAKPGSGAVHVF